MNTTISYLSERKPSDPHDPLTRRVPRTLREAENDPRAWFQSGFDAFEEEERIRAMFAERRIQSRFSVWAHRVIYAIALAAAIFWWWL